MQSSQVRKLDLPSTSGPRAKNKDLPPWAKNLKIFPFDFFTTNRSHIIKSTKAYVRELSEWRSKNKKKDLLKLKAVLRRLMMFLHTFATYIDSKMKLESEMEEQLISLVSLYMNFELRYLKSLKRESIKKSQPHSSNANAANAVASASVSLNNRGELIVGDGTIDLQTVVRYQQLLTNRFSHWIYILLPSHEHRVDALLSTTIYTKSMRPVLDPIFRKILSEMPNGPFSSVSYVRHMLAFKTWQEQCLVGKDEESRALCSYIERHLKPLDFKSFPDGLARCLGEGSTFREHARPYTVNLKEECEYFISFCRKLPHAGEHINLESISEGISLLDDDNLYEEGDEISKLMNMISHRKSRRLAIEQTQTGDVIDLTGSSNQKKRKKCTRHVDPSDVIDLTEDDFKTTFNTNNNNNKFAVRTDLFSPSSSSSSSSSFSSMSSMLHYWRYSKTQPQPLELNPAPPPSPAPPTPSRVHTSANANKTSAGIPPPPKVEADALSRVTDLGGDDAGCRTHERLDCPQQLFLESLLLNPLKDEQAPVHRTHCPYHDGRAADPACNNTTDFCDYLTRDLSRTCATERCDGSEQTGECVQTNDCETANDVCAGTSDSCAGTNDCVGTNDGCVETNDVSLEINDSCVETNDSCVETNDVCAETIESCAETAESSSETNDVCTETTESAETFDVCTETIESCTETTESAETTESFTETTESAETTDVCTETTESCAETAESSSETNDVCTETTESCTETTESTETTDVCTETTESCTETTESAETTESCTKTNEICEETTESAETTESCTKTNEICEETTESAETTESCTKTTEICTETTKSCDDVCAETNDENSARFDELIISDETSIAIDTTNTTNVEIEAEIEAEVEAEVEVEVEAEVEPEIEPEETISREHTPETLDKRKPSIEGDENQNLDEKTIEQSKDEEELNIITTDETDSNFEQQKTDLIVNIDETTKKTIEVEENPEIITEKQTSQDESTVVKSETQVEEDNSGFEMKPRKNRVRRTETSLLLQNSHSNRKRKILDKEPLGKRKRISRRPEEAPAEYTTEESTNKENLKTEDSKSNVRKGRRKQLELLLDCDRKDPIELDNCQDVRKGRRKADISAKNTETSAETEDQDVTPNTTTTTTKRGRKKSTDLPETPPEISEVDHLFSDAASTSNVSRKSRNNKQIPETDVASRRLRKTQAPEICDVNNEDATLKKTKQKNYKTKKKEATSDENQIDDNAPTEIVKLVEEKPKRRRKQNIKDTIRDENKLTNLAETNEMVLNVFVEVVKFKKFVKRKNKIVEVDESVPPAPQKEKKPRGRPSKTKPKRIENDDSEDDTPLKSRLSVKPETVEKILPPRRHKPEPKPEGSFLEEGPSNFARTKPSNKTKTAVRPPSSPSYKKSPEGRDEPPATFKDLKIELIMEPSPIKKSNLKSPTIGAFPPPKKSVDFSPVIHETEIESRHQTYPRAISRKGRNKALLSPRKISLQKVLPEPKAPTSFTFVQRTELDEHVKNTRIADYVATEKPNAAPGLNNVERTPFVCAHPKKLYSRKAQLRLFEMQESAQTPPEIKPEVVIQNVTSVETVSVAEIPGTIEQNVEKDTINEIQNEEVETPEDVPLDLSISEEEKSSTSRDSNTGKENEMLVSEFIATDEIVLDFTEETVVSFEQIPFTEETAVVTEESGVILEETAAVVEENVTVVFKETKLNKNIEMVENTCNPFDIQFGKIDENITIVPCTNQSGNKIFENYENNFDEANSNSALVIDTVNPETDPVNMIDVVETLKNQDEIKPRSVGNKFLVDLESGVIETIDVNLEVVTFNETDEYAEEYLQTQIEPHKISLPITITKPEILETCITFNGDFGQIEEIKATEIFDDSFKSFQDHGCKLTERLELHCPLQMNLANEMLNTTEELPSDDATPAECRAHESIVFHVNKVVECQENLKLLAELASERNKTVNNNSIVDAVTPTSQLHYDVGGAHVVVQTQQDAKNTIQVVNIKNGAVQTQTNRKRKNGTTNTIYSLLTELEDVISQDELSKNKNKDAAKTDNCATADEVTTNSIYRIDIPYTAELQLTPDLDDDFIIQPKIETPPVGVLDAPLIKSPPKVDYSKIESLVGCNDDKPETKVETPKAEKPNYKKPKKPSPSILLEKYKNNVIKKSKTDVKVNKPNSYIRTTRPSRMVTVKLKNDAALQKAKTEKKFDELCRQHKEETEKTENKTKEEESTPVLIIPDLEHQELRKHNKMTENHLETDLNEVNVTVEQVNVIEEQSKSKISNEETPETIPSNSEETQNEALIPSNNQGEAITEVDENVVELKPKRKRNKSIKNVEEHAPDVFEETRHKRKFDFDEKNDELRCKRNKNINANNIEIKKEINDKNFDELVQEYKQTLADLNKKRAKINEDDKDKVFDLLLEEHKKSLINSEENKSKSEQQNSIESFDLVSLQGNISSQNTETLKEKDKDPTDRIEVVQNWIDNRVDSDPETEHVYETIEECTYFDELSNNSMSSPNTADGDDQEAAKKSETEKPFEHYQTPDSGISMTNDDDSVQKHRTPDHEDLFVVDNVQQEVQAIETEADASVLVQIPLHKIQDTLPFIKEKLATNKRSLDLEIDHYEDEDTIKRNKVDGIEEREPNVPLLAEDVTPQENRPFLSKGAVKAFPTLLSLPDTFSSPYPSEISITEETDYLVEGIDLCNDIPCYESFDSFNEQESLQANINDLSVEVPPIIETKQTLQPDYCSADNQFTLPDLMNENYIMSVIIDNMNVYNSNKGMLPVNMHQVQPEMKPSHSVLDETKRNEFEDYEEEHAIRGFVDGICNDKKIFPEQTSNEIQLSLYNQETKEVEVLITNIPNSFLYDEDGPLQMEVVSNIPEEQTVEEATSSSNVAECQVNPATGVFDSATQGMSSDLLQNSNENVVPVDSIVDKSNFIEQPSPPSQQPSPPQPIKITSDNHKKETKRKYQHKAQTSSASPIIQTLNLHSKMNLTKTQDLIKEPTISNHYQNNHHNNHQNNHHNHQNNHHNNQRHHVSHHKHQDFVKSQQRPDRRNSEPKNQETNYYPMVEHPKSHKYFQDFICPPILEHLNGTDTRHNSEYYPQQSSHSHSHSYRSHSHSDTGYRSDDSRHRNVYRTNQLQHLLKEFEAINNKCAKKK